MKEDLKELLTAAAILLLAWVYFVIAWVVLVP